MNIVLKLKDFAFILLAFAIPLSVALTNILIILFSLLWIIEGDFMKKIFRTSSTNWFVSILLLSFLYLLGLTYGDYHSDYFYVLKRIIILFFFIPVLTSRLSKGTINYSIIFFLFANFLAASVALLINYNVISSFFETASISAFLMYNYHNILLSFSSLLSFLLYIKSNHKYSFLYLILIYIKITNCMQL